jgi:Spherulation-specific family 4
LKRLILCFLLVLLGVTGTVLTLNGKGVRAKKLELLVPLYTYPNHYQPRNYGWKQLGIAKDRVRISAIVNPQNGPGKGPPNADYQVGLRDLRANGVQILGYVATNYGRKSIAAVQAEIETYHQYYAVQGIFLDEAASGRDQLAYYRSIYEAIKAKNSHYLVVTNQGTQTVLDYITKPAADVVVICENTSTAWTDYKPDQYLSQYPADRFAALIHSAPDIATMKQQVDRAIARNIGYIYVTDDSLAAPDQNPWDSLPSYWQAQVDYIAGFSATGTRK